MPVKPSPSVPALHSRGSLTSSPFRLVLTLRDTSFLLPLSPPLWLQVNIQQGDDDDNSNDDDRPDYIEVEIPQSVGVAPSQQSRVHLERGTIPPGFPSTPPPSLAPGSTLHSAQQSCLAPTVVQVPPSTQEGQPAPAKTVNNRRSCLSQVAQTLASSACKTRIPPIPPHDAGTGGAGGRREPGTDRTTMTRVSSSAGATPPPSFLLHLSSAPVYGPTPDARLRAAIATPPKFRSPDLHLELLHDPSYKTHVARLHFNAIYILIELKVPESGLTRSSRL
ncbi:hypothetical protein F5888DRAFT_1803346 [Russula emetica]|nr:hypothetical protein F5888DRAFT_1803346 [Russula emetica]